MMEITIWIQDDPGNHEIKYRAETSDWDDTEKVDEWAQDAVKRALRMYRGAED